DRVLPDPAPPIVRLDEADVVTECADPLESIARPSNAAYIVFTSGSTGEPKGSIVEHRAIADRALAQAEGLDPSDRSLHFLSPIFDAALDEILPALVSGATLVVHPDPRGETPAGFIERCRRHQVSVAHLPVGF